MAFRIPDGGTGGRQAIERKSGEAGDLRHRRVQGALCRAAVLKLGVLALLLLIASINIADDRASSPANHCADAGVATA